MVHKQEREMHLLHFINYSSGVADNSFGFPSVFSAMIYPHLPRIHILYIIIGKYSWLDWLNRFFKISKLSLSLPLYWDREKCFCMRKYPWQWWLGTTLLSLDNTYQYCILFSSTLATSSTIDKQKFFIHASSRLGATLTLYAFIKLKFLVFHFNEVLRFTSYNKLSGCQCNTIIYCLHAKRLHFEC